MQARSSRDDLAAPNKGTARWRAPSAEPIIPSTMNEYLTSELWFDIFTYLDSSATRTLQCCAKENIPFEILPLLWEHHLNTIGRSSNECSAYASSSQSPVTPANLFRFSQFLDKFKSTAFALRHATRVEEKFP